MRRPRELKKVIRRGKDAGRDPEGNLTEAREGGRAFRREDQMVAKDLDWAIVVLTLGLGRKNGVVYAKYVADKGERI